MTDREHGGAPVPGMTPADGPDDALGRRLGAWFAGEVQQASVDLARRPLGSGRRSGRVAALPLGPAAALLVVVIAVVAGITRLPGVVPGTEPTGPVGTATPQGTAPVASGTPEPDPTTTATPPATDITARYQDGIPQLIGGERVIRPSSIERLGPVDDRSFLLGGWSFGFQGFVYGCPIIIGTPPPFGPPRCGSQWIAETPTFGAEPRVTLQNWSADIPAGPVVLRVHRYDERAATCSAETRSACNELAVIEDVVWTGDEVTAVSPLSALQAFNGLIGADPGLQTATLEAVGILPADGDATQTPIPTAGDGRGPYSGTNCKPPYPVLAWRTTDPVIDVQGQRPVPQVEIVLVYPSTEERIRLGGRLTASGWAGLDGCAVIFESFYSRTWISVDNVMVAVTQGFDGPTRAEAELIEAVRSALEGTPVKSQVVV
ncbi:MAG: hypothetical protein HYX57_07605 [Chloroflexi bacterium]|nr:hypothetical protein [Chloroflexota bacterium]